MTMTQGDINPCDDLDRDDWSHWDELEVGVTLVAVSDEATEPFSPPSAIREVHPEDLNGGQGGGTMGHTFPVQKRAIQIIATHRRSANYKGHISGTNKDYYIWSDTGLSSNRVILGVYGDGIDNEYGTLSPGIGLQNTENADENIGGTVPIDRSDTDYYRTKLQVEMDAPGGGDGRLRLYVDPDNSGTWLLSISRDNLELTPVGGDDGYNTDLHVSHIYGGAEADPVPETQECYTGQIDLQFADTIEEFTDAYGDDAPSEDVATEWDGDVPAYEIWKGFKFDGGTLVESHPDIREAKIAFDIDGQNESLTFRYPASSNAAYATKEGRILVRRVKIKPIQGTNRTSYWVIAKKIPRTDGWVTVQCVPIASILADYIVEEVVAETGFTNGDITRADATPTEHLTGSLLPALPEFFSIGEVSSSDRLNYGQSGVTAGEWCVAFAKAIGSEFRCEVAEDESGLVLSFPTTIGEGADKVWVETGKNLDEIEQTHDYFECATHVRAVDADGRSLEHNAFDIDTVQSGGNWGDVNNSGGVNIVDAQQVARYVAGLSVANLYALIQRGDVTGDGKIDSDDATAIAQYAVFGSGGVTDPTAATRIAAACGQTLFVLVDPLARAIAAVPILGTLTGCFLARDQATYSDEEIVRSHEPFAPNEDTLSFVLVEDDSDFAEGDTVVVRQATGENSERLTILTNPAALEDGTTRRLARISRSNITALRNLVDNGFCREYSDPDDAPDGWTYYEISGTPGLTIERSTSDTLYGGYSTRVYGTMAASSKVALVVPVVWPWHKGPDGLVCAKTRITIEYSGTLDFTKFHFEVTDDPDAAAVSTVTTKNLAGANVTSDPGTFDLSIKGVDPSDFPTGLFLRIYIEEAGAAAATIDFSVDVMQLTPGGADPQVYIEGPEVNLLYGVVGKTLLARTPSVTSYVFTLRDLSRAELAEFLEDEIVLGGNVGFVAPEIDTEEDLRVIRYELNEDDPLDSVIHASTRKQRLIDLLARQAAASLHLDVGGLAQSLAREIRRAPFGDGDTAIESVVLDEDDVETTSKVRIPSSTFRDTTADLVSKAGKRLLSPLEAA